MAKRAAKKNDKPWLQSYPDGVAQEIGELEYQSVSALLNAACERNSNHPAFSCMGKSLSYSDLLAESKKISNWLQTMGLEKGDRVAIMMPNILQYPVTLMGVLGAGCTVVNVNPLYTPRELKHQLNDSGAKAIFVLENFASTFEAVAKEVEVEHAVVTSMGEMLGGLKGLIVNTVVRHVKKMVPFLEHTRTPQIQRCTFNQWRAEAS